MYAMSHIVMFMAAQVLMTSACTQWEIFILPSIVAFTAAQVVDDFSMQPFLKKNKRSGSSMCWENQCVPPI